MVELRKSMTTATLSKKQYNDLLETLQSRFQKNSSRHPGLDWAKVLSKLEANPKNSGLSMKWKEPAANPT